MEQFDPYRKWLGIPPHEQPPNHYRLLGIERFESDRDVIANAADRQMAHLRTFQGGKNSVYSQKLLNELAAARICLLNKKKREEYNALLMAEMEIRARSDSPSGSESFPTIQTSPSLAIEFLQDSKAEPDPEFSVPLRPVRFSGSMRRKRNRFVGPMVVVVITSVAVGLAAWLLSLAIELRLFEFR